MEGKKLSPPILKATWQEGMGGFRFRPGNQKVYLETNIGEEHDLSFLAEMDPRTGELQKLESDPLGRVDISRAAFSEATDELVGTVYLDDRKRNYWRDEGFERGRELSVEERLKRQSPLFSVERMRAPLLVVQGANDPRVKKAESDQIVAAYRKKGQAVEYLVAADEGHGFARPDNRLAAMLVLERFLHRHVGSDLQKEAPDWMEAKAQALIQGGDLSR